MEVGALKIHALMGPIFGIVGGIVVLIFGLVAGPLVITFLTSFVTALLDSSFSQSASVLNLVALSYTFGLVIISFGFMAVGAYSGYKEFKA